MFRHFYLGNHKLSHLRCLLWISRASGFSRFILSRFMPCLKYSCMSFPNSSMMLSNPFRFSSLSWALISFDITVSFNVGQSPKNIGSVQVLNYTSDLAARSLHPSARSAALFSITGSYSGYQADPAQLPEDMVHTGRHSCFPDRLHSAVCGNEEIKLLKQQKAHSVLQRVSVHKTNMLLILHEFVGGL